MGVAGFRRSGVRGQAPLQQTSGQCAARERRKSHFVIAFALAAPAQPVISMFIQADVPEPRVDELGSARSCGVTEVEEGRLHSKSRCRRHRRPERYVNQFMSLRSR